MSGGWSKVSDTWRRDHPWAGIYSAAMAHPRLSRPLSRLTLGTDLSGLDDAIASIAAVRPGGVVLDVPCGAGLALIGLDPGHPVTYLGADLAPAMLARARGSARRLRIAVPLLQADVGRLPLPDGAVDLCLSLTGLHCFPDPRAAVLELARVTRDRLELTWFRSDVALHHRPVLVIGRAAGVIGASATISEVTGWLGEAGFTTRARREGAFGFVTARRA